MVFRRIFRKKRVGNAAVIDLGKLNELQEKNKMLKQASTATQIQNANDVGFLGALANAANSGSTEPPRIAVSGQTFEKMERLHKRIDRLINKFELLERKIERIERRLDLKY